MRGDRLYRTPAVVLKRMDLGEADRILTLYTRDFGKLRAVAKGVRRTKSRTAGHVEPFAVGDLLLARGRELDVVLQAETIVAMRHVREDLDATSHAYYLVELTDLMTEDRLENHEVFSALTEALVALDESVEARLVVVRFLLRFLLALGYGPELTACVQCRVAISPGMNGFSHRLGGVLCPSCAPREPSARPVANDVLKLLRHFQRTPGRAFVSAPAVVSNQAERLLREYAEQIMERRLRTPALIVHVHQAGQEAGL